MQSMTAYGQSVVTTEQGEFTWELRSVNQRHLDIGIRLPEPLRSIDVQVRTRLSSKVHRGKIDMQLRHSGSVAGCSRLVLDHGLLEQLAEAVQQVSRLPMDSATCDPLQLLQWPGVVTVESSLDEGAEMTALAAFDTALDDFMSSREREGQQIASMLSERVAQLSVLLDMVRKHRPTVVQRQRQRLLHKLSELDVSHDSDRLEQELVYAAQRLDIDEELDRLNAHLTEFALILKRDEPVGRRLDFLMQELNREVNTIASKSADSITTAASVDMKVLIEQMREQVQNVE